MDFSTQPQTLSAEDDPPNSHLGSPLPDFLKQQLEEDLSSSSDSTSTSDAGEQCSALDEPIVFHSPPFSWVTPKVYLKRLPFGIGMFAKEFIAKDELVIGWAGKVVHLKEVLALAPEDRGHILQIDEFIFQVPFWPQYTEPANYTNHSCDPSCGFGNSPVSLVAMRDIHPDDEITFDYAMSEDIEGLAGNCDWDCLCGASNCRKRFTGADWKQPALWERYGNYFSPHIIKKINVLKKQLEEPSSVTPSTLAQPYDLNANVVNTIRV